MYIKYDKIGSTLHKEIKKRNLTISDVSEALQIPYASLHNFLHNKAAKQFIERLGKLADFLNITKLTIYFTNSEPDAIEENLEDFNPYILDLRKLTPETAKLILKLYYNDETIKNRLGL